MPSLDDALALTILDGAAHARVTPEWGQGRAVFGGVLAGLAVRAARARVGPGRPLRSILLDFVSPAEVGEVRVVAEVHREGRAYSHAEVRILQGDELRALAILAFGADRPTAVRVDGAGAPPGPGPDEGPALPYVEGLFPAFTQWFDFRWTDGELPYTGGARPAFAGWVRPRAATTVDEALVLALVDAWPAPVLSLMRGPAPSSTVTWMVDFVGPVTGPADAWWRFAADTLAAGDGHASVQGQLWSADGALVAVSRQLVAEFSRG